MEEKNFCNDSNPNHEYNIFILDNHANQKQLTINITHNKISSTTTHDFDNVYSHLSDPNKNGISAVAYKQSLTPGKDYLYTLTALKRIQWNMYGKFYMNFFYSQINQFCLTKKKLIREYKLSTQSEEPTIHELMFENSLYIYLYCCSSQNKFIVADDQGFIRKYNVLDDRLELSYDGFEKDFINYSIGSCNTYKNMIFCEEENCFIKSDYDVSGLEKYAFDEKLDDKNEVSVLVKIDQMTNCDKNRMPDNPRFSFCLLNPSILLMPQDKGIVDQFSIKQHFRRTFTYKFGNFNIRKMLSIKSGEFQLVTDDKGCMKLINMKRKQLIKHFGQIWDIEYSQVTDIISTEDFRYVLVSNDKGAIKMYSISTGKLIHNFSEIMKTNIVSLAV